jgi:phosphate-selective porin OprO/OprP
MKENGGFRVFLVVAIVLLLLSGRSVAVLSNDGTIASDQEKEKDKGFTIEWRDGFRVTSADGRFKLRFGGRVMNDWMWVSAGDAIKSAFGNIVNGNEFRYAWIEFGGEVYDNVEFAVQYSFSSGDVQIKDMYIGLMNLPFGRVRVGHFKEPFSLDEMVSNKNTTFMERNLADIFAPSRNTGFAVLGANKAQNITWGFGVFTDANEYGDAKTYDNTFNVSGRLTFLPWSADSDLLHLGIGYHYQGVKDGGAIRYQQRPEVHLATRFVDTGNILADYAQTIDVEGALVYGQFSLQGEYMYDSVSSETADDPVFQGGYIYGTYFLTPGDHRSYEKANAVFGRTRPKNPWLAGGGMGAVEVALRYSWVDFTDALVTGGELKDVTLGLNWYLNNVTRIMLNIVHADRDGIGTANFFMTRFQIDF